MKFVRVKAVTTPSYLSVNKSRSMPQLANSGVFDCEIAEDRPGMMVLKISGHGAQKRFKPESGGHRWQRIPPTERSGRVQSSTVTVAVMPVPRDISVLVRDCDCEILTCRGSGPGGQKRNKTETAVQVKHKPSGLMVRCDQERSQQQNKITALAILAARLTGFAVNAAKSTERELRRNQVGTGERSDKVRTVQVKNGIVFSLHGRKTRLAEYLKGHIEPVQDVAVSAG